uniref:Arrestin C-terminal-like domain-containing protein n=1 Tax=Photinus pyralis TaxID=7054 RepID=A0A1Y1LCP4_PHOPY
MPGSCGIVFEKQIYRPGEVVNGKVHCTFAADCKVRDIKITFSGRIKVSWKVGKTTVYKREPLFEMESGLLLCETSFTPGYYVYPFTFNLPGNLPSSIEVLHGSVKYKAHAKIDKEWCIDDTCEKVFTVYSCYYLGSMISSPIESVKEKIPLSLGAEGPIRLTVNLSNNCYAPNQMVPFIATVRNNSGTTVNEVRFKIMQGFTFEVNERTTETIQTETQELAVIDSVVNPRDERFWNLELRIPADTFIGNMPNCDCMKIFWKIKVCGCVRRLKFVCVFIYRAKCICLFLTGICT